MPDAMTSRERFRAVCRGQPIDRLPMVEWVKWWPETIHRWAGEGLGYGADYHYDIDTVVRLQREFGLDPWVLSYLSPAGPGLPQPIAHGAGIVADMDGYRRLHHLLRQEMPSDGGFAPPYRQGQLAGDAILFLNLEGFFWWPRRLLGIERHLYAFADQPELLHAINADQAAWMLRTIASLETVPDLVMLGEDLSYNHGPMLSRRSFDEFLAPYYRQVVPALKARGIRVFIDSDGDVTSCLDWFAGVGIEGVLPLERQAGVDIAGLQAARPEMLFLGHFDKMTMPHGEAAMRQEFERLLPAMRRGRFIPSVDHQTPPGVSLAQYRIYARLLREYAELGAPARLRSRSSA